MTKEQALKIAKPILFNTDMVKAIQDGTKTVTRRIIKPKFTNTEIVIKAGKAFETVTTTEIKPPYQVGDLLYVREAWNCLPIPEPLRGMSNTYWYKADGAEEGDKWRPSIHMPKEAARIFLRVTGVRVERLQDCGNMQAKDEGCTCCSQFVRIWNSTVKKSDLDKYGWNANPWVGVIEFERVEVSE